MIVKYVNFQLIMMLLWLSFGAFHMLYTEDSALSLVAGVWITISLNRYLDSLSGITHDSKNIEKTSK